MVENMVHVKEVAKPRLIAALLSELDASAATIMAECGASGDVFQKTLQCELKVPFESTEVYLDLEGHPAETLNCTCCIAGQRLSFQLVKIDGPRWRLPTLVSLLDFRAERRLAFASKMYSAELISPRGTVYGYAVDVNRDYLAVDLDADQVVDREAPLRVIIRMINSSCDAFYNQCLVAQVKPLREGGTRLILRLERPGDGKSEQRRHERRLVRSASLQLSVETFLDHDPPVNLAVRNASLGGMTLEADHNKTVASLIPGMIVRSKDPDLTYLVVWARERGVGLRPLLPEARALAEWCLYIDRIAPPEDHSVKASRRDLAKLLTHSGLLKGRRRSHFGRNLEAHLQSQPTPASTLLMQRRIVANQMGEPVLSICLRRYTESAWLCTDGASFSEKRGGFAEIVQSSIETVRAMMDISFQFPRYATFVWHHAVKSSVEYTETLSQQSKSLILDAAQLSIKALETQIGSDASLDVEITDLYRASAERRRQISSTYSPELYEAIVGADGSHPVLNAELAKHGPYHKAVTKLVRVPGESDLIAHRIFTHNVWSTTGVTNSVFVLCPQGIDAATLTRGLAALARHEIAYGTDDFLMIFDGPPGSADAHVDHLPRHKRFSFMVHDLLLNQALAFKDEPLREQRSEKDT